MNRCLTDEEVEQLVGVPSLDGDAVVLGARAHLDECAACQELVALLGPQAARPEEMLFDRFRIIRELGRGGMGIVYLVWDPKLRRPLAIKILHSTDASAEQRIQREAQALARLAHPNIVPVFDVGTTERGVYMTMEFVRGASLRAWIEAADRSPAEILDVFLQAGEGLHVVHRSGIVHRDFKPENVLVGDDGRVRIVDFGLAHAEVVPERTLAADQDTCVLTLTRSGFVVGTPAYMAPEQHRGQAADERSDQFSFCVSLWEALYGARPFSGTTPGAILANIEHRTLSARERADRDPLASVLLRGLAADPAERHASMFDLLRALRTEQPAKRMRGRRVAAAGLGALALAAATGAWISLAPDVRGDVTPAAVRFEPTAFALEKAPERLGVEASPVLEKAPQAEKAPTERLGVEASPVRTRPAAKPVQFVVAAPSAAPSSALALVPAAEAPPTAPRLGPNGAPLIK